MEDLTEVIVTPVIYVLACKKPMFQGVRDGHNNTNKSFLLTPNIIYYGNDSGS
jgi:hypothetical protein